MNNKQLLIIFSLLLTGNYASFAQTQKAKDKEAKTTFQTAEPWKPETDGTTTYRFITKQNGTTKEIQEICRTFSEVIAKKSWKTIG